MLFYPLLSMIHAVYNKPLVDRQKKEPEMNLRMLCSKYLLFIPTVFYPLLSMIHVAIDASVNPLTCLLSRGHQSDSCFNFGCFLHYRSFQSIYLAEVCFSHSMEENSFYSAYSEALYTCMGIYMYDSVYYIETANSLHI
jgi:hypothetical protein